MTASPRGFALLIVLWSVVLLALLTTGMTAAGRSDLQLAGNLRRSAAAEAAADGGIAAAIFHACDAPARAWSADDQPRTLRIGAYTLTVRVLDEGGKVNPNFAPPELLAGLMTASGADPRRAAELAQAIAEWHQIGVHDALVQRYRSAGMAAAPTGQPFRSVAELGLVIGMTPDLLARLAPHLSVFAEGALQIARADPVIQATMRGLGVTAQPGTAERPIVINVTADASGPDGSRFIRRAVVSLRPDGPPSGTPNTLTPGLATPGKTAGPGRPFRILSWEALPSG